ncbi:MAG: cysteine desulfurase NifS [Clostridiales bacterium]|nr:cysteine desulfurase NifS [Clostridiales bacterium]
MTKTKIYMDNAATTKLSDKAFEAMVPFLIDSYGNASSIYALGREAQIALTNSRESIAKSLNCEGREIFFTSGGSEADNWAIKGAALQMLKKGKKHIITTEFEHHAVLHVLDGLKKQGFEITYLPVNENGVVKVSDFENAIREDTGFSSIMFVNNEIGTIQPISEIGSICKEKGICFHTDAVQAIGNVKINIKELNVDMLSISAHKIHGPKGVGLLYIRKGLRIPNLIEGGAQEMNRRAGTENIAGIVGFSQALKESVRNLDDKNSRLIRLRDKIIENFMKIERVHLNGDLEKRVPANLNFSFEGVEGESLLLMLDQKGIAASSGSACTSGSLDPSHVLLALGLPHEVAHGSLRLSMSDLTTEKEVDEVISTVPEIISYLRSFSPLWDHIKENEKNK